MPSRKTLVAIGVATVGVTLIGLGVRASFTTSVDVTQTISTGNVNALITDATWTTFNGEGFNTPIEVGGAPFSPGVSSINIGTSSNNGSQIDEIFTITVVNTGSLDMTLNCTIAATSGDSTVLSDELNVLDAGAIDVSSFGTLSDVENNGTNVCGDNQSTIPAGGTLVQEVEIYSNEGGLDSAAMGQSITPVLTISGQDTNSGFGNQPTP